MARPYEDVWITPSLLSPDGANGARTAATRRDKPTRRESSPAVSMEVLLLSSRMCHVERDTLTFQHHAEVWRRTRKFRSRAGDIREIRAIRRLGRASREDRVFLP